jgi:hypothetical protein
MVLQLRLDDDQRPLTLLYSDHKLIRRPLVQLFHSHVVDRKQELFNASAPSFAKELK